MSTQADDIIFDLIDYVRNLCPQPSYPLVVSSKDVLLHSIKSALPTGWGMTFDHEGDVWVRLAPVHVHDRPAPPAALVSMLDPHVSAFDPPSWRKGMVADGRLMGIFDAYVQGPWAQWRSHHQAQAQAFDRYHGFLAAYKTLNVDGGAEGSEVVCGMGLLRWRYRGAPVHAPLVLQSCEVGMDEATGCIEVRPATAAPALNMALLDVLDLPMRAGLVAAWNQWRGREDLEDLSPFSMASWEGFWREAAVLMHPDGVCCDQAPMDHGDDPGGMRDGLFGAAPVIDMGWTILVQQRAIDRMVMDLERLADAVRAGQPLPEPVRLMLDPSGVHVEPAREVRLRGLEHVQSSSGSYDGDLYFPLPYNDEQVRVAALLEQYGGAIVQGPPGTGKSHTIANIICHYLAQGKRVLVTAASAAALGVVRDKIPESVRDLSATLLSSDAASVKEFEHSIAMIAERLAQHQPHLSERTIARLDEQLQQGHDALDALDAQMTALASQRLEPVEVVHDGEGPWVDGLPQGRVSGEALARWVVDHDVADAGGWFCLGHSIREGRLTLSALPMPMGMLQGAMAARERLGEDVVAASQPRVPDQALPPLRMILEARTAKISLQDLDLQQAQLGGVEVLGREDSAHMVHLEQAAALLQERCALRTKLHEHTLAHHVGALALKIQEASQAKTATFENFLLVVQDVERRWPKFWAYRSRVHFDPSLPNSSEAMEALATLAEGDNPFPVWALGKGALKTLVMACRLDGREARKASDWKVVLRHAIHMRELGRAVRVWSKIASAWGLEEASSQPLSIYETLHDQVMFCRDVWHCHGALRSQLETSLMTLLRHDVAMDILHDNDQRALARIQATLAYHQQREHAMRMLRPFETIVERLAPLANHEGLGRDMMLLLQEQMLTLDAGEVEQRWTALMARWERLERCRSDLEIVGHAVSWLQNAGHVGLAQAMASDTSLGVMDVAQAWQVAQMRQTLHTKMGEALDPLLAQRRAVVDQLAHTYEQMVAARAWHATAEHSPPAVRQALQRYLNAVKKMGKGTGKRADRHRSVARTAMQDAYLAVPCWIMPLGRVSESMPAQLGVFDLVVIDEASQANITALPSLMRGQRLLVVGDDKQVSPTGAGVREDEILASLNTRLQRLPLRFEMTPDKSLYDLFAVVFAGRNVMLREHFRCVPDIIAYSNKAYYHGMMAPLRLPPAHERVWPALVDVWVEDGRRVGDENEAEAMAIVQEIVRLVNDPDPAMAHKSLGVVTLMGNDKQAVLIKRLINTYVPQEVQLARHLSVGPPAQFQGSERDIVLLSMVWSEGHGPGDRADAHQRFNVAMSRARDRLYLFHSLPHGQAKPGSLLAGVMDFFQPSSLEDNGDQTKTAAEMPSSMTFMERALFERLRQAHYRVTWRPRGLAYHLDLLVEDSQGRRLAVMCDGDGADDAAGWPRMMKDQRVMERAGWVFWRCFALDFVLHPQTCWTRLQHALDQAGIVPDGAMLGAERTTNVVALVARGSSLMLAGPSLVGEAADVTPWLPNAQEALPILLERCGSAFEQDLVRFVHERGYRVGVQVPCHGYRVDMVVWDGAGHHLALEADGDRFHGMDQVDSDWRRQHFLEQHGFVFWRAWASDFVQHPQEVFNRLLEALRDRCVAPDRDGNGVPPIS